MDRSRIFVDQFRLGEGDLTVAVKDCIDIAGYRTACGSGALADVAPAASNARIVENILDGGARIVGKVAMHELAYGVTGINGWFGTTPNPLFPDLITGGSSSGSAAAVAAGLVDIAIGTDTGGSVRMPAACCGIVGLKPTFARVSRDGCKPETTTLDCVGPLARDMVALQQGMALVDPGFAEAPVPESLRLGIVTVGADAAVEAGLEEFLAALGAEIVPIEIDGMEEAFQAGMTLMAAEAWAAYGPLVEDPRMGNDVRQRLLGASKVTAEQVEQAEGVRTAFAARVDAALAGVDALVMPTLPTLPPTLDELSDPSVTLRLTALVRPFNLTGHPALTLPAGTVQGRPIGCQLIGTMGGDEHLCAIGRAVEIRANDRVSA